jgi:hypothetical protein
LIPVCVFSIGRSIGINCAIGENARPTFRGEIARFNAPQDFSALPSIEAVQVSQVCLVYLTFSDYGIFVNLVRQEEQVGAETPLSLIARQSAPGAGRRPVPIKGLPNAGGGQAWTENRGSA